MTYYIKNFRREKDCRTVGGLDVTIEAETREELSQKVCKYFGVDEKVPKYSGPDVHIEVFEDEFGFRSDPSTTSNGGLVTYVGILEYSGPTRWQDVERAIIITGSESNR